MKLIQRRLRTGKHLASPRRTTALLVCSLQLVKEGGGGITSHDTMVVRFTEGMLGVRCHASFYDHGGWVGDIRGSTRDFVFPTWHGTPRAVRMTRMARALFSALTGIGALVEPVSTPVCSEDCEPFLPPDHLPHGMLLKLAKLSARTFRRGDEFVRTQLYLL